MVSSDGHQELQQGYQRQSSTVTPAGTISSSNRNSNLANARDCARTRALLMTQKYNASLTFEELGDPANPLHFPTPDVRQVDLVECFGEGGGIEGDGDGGLYDVDVVDNKSYERRRVVDHVTGRFLDSVEDVLVRRPVAAAAAAKTGNGGGGSGIRRASTSQKAPSPSSSSDDDSSLEDAAYALKEKIAQTKYGFVYVCSVLRRRRQRQQEQQRQNRETEGSGDDGDDDESRNCSPTTTIATAAVSTFSSTSTISSGEFFDAVNNGTDSSYCVWETTDEHVVLKCSSFDRIRAARTSHSLRCHHHLQHGRGGAGCGTATTANNSNALLDRYELEDPWKEAAALQHVGDYNPSILGCIEVLKDEDWLYVVMPYCRRGDLYHWFTAVPAPAPAAMKHQHHRHPTGSTASTAATSTSSCAAQAPRRVSEQQALVWFRQLLRGLAHLQKKGVCHRDVSLENLLVDANNNLKLVDFGLALRVPYTDTNNDYSYSGSVCDVSEGGIRCLINKQRGAIGGSGCGHHGGAHGNLIYQAPELLREDESAYDGFAVDLWSAGVVLFIMLVGRAPFRIAHPSDQRYVQISRGGLASVLSHLGIRMSDYACHLLQRMLLSDPNDRMTISEVMSHPWVAEVQRPSSVDTLMRRITEEGAYYSSTEEVAPPRDEPSPVTVTGGAGGGNGKAVGTSAVATDKTYKQEQQQPQKQKQVEQQQPGKTEESLDTTVEKKSPLRQRVRMMASGGRIKPSLSKARRLLATSLQGGVKQQRQPNP